MIGMRRRAATTVDSDLEKLRARLVALGKQARSSTWEIGDTYNEIAERFGIAAAHDAVAFAGLSRSTVESYAKACKDWPADSRIHGDLGMFWYVDALRGRERTEAVRLLALYASMPAAERGKHTRLRIKTGKSHASALEIAVEVRRLLLAADVDGALRYVEEIIAAKRPKRG